MFIAKDIRGRYDFDRVGHSRDEVVRLLSSELFISEYDVLERFEIVEFEVREV